jgi:membrane carboxypeptidase/penicillin-binding protein
MPQVMKDAVLAAEDARFYQHGGVDYKGVARAALENLRDARSQGASTITMQVARNFYLSTEKTFTRKIYEILLALKIESLLSKDQILELYMNQIFLGQRAYGFAAAAEIYFGKPLKDVTVAEAAMLAGLPKAPSAYNPIANPSAPRSASATSSTACSTTASSPRAARRGAGTGAALPHPVRRRRCTPNSWPKRRASWSLPSTATRPTRAA